MFGVNVRMCLGGRVYKFACSVILVFAYLQSVGAQSGCTTASGQKGSCVALDQCPMLIEVVNALTYREDINTWNNRADFLRKSICGGTADNPRVCCPKKHRNQHLVANKNCGDAQVPRIHKGTEAIPFEFPWMALIAYRTGNKIDYQCGGSLINARYVLTAAHCIRTRYPVVGVRLGEHDTKLPLDCYNANSNCPRVQDIPVEDTIVHEEYADKVNDIALIRLARNADLSKINVIPICLPVTPVLRLVSLLGTTPTIAGWGTTEKVAFSSVLRKVQLTVIDNALCQDKFSTPLVRAQHISESEKGKFCAYGPKGEDSCTGDSGGPLMVFNEQGAVKRYVIYGIVSYGSQTCSAGVPSVFTNVDTYIEWILDRLMP